MRYRPIFSDSAVSFFVSLSRRKQWKLLDRAQELASDPFLIPDFRAADDEGREISHVLVDGFLFTYWVDHSSSVVMIVEIDDGE
jgi:hypothetical protein